MQQWSTLKKLIWLRAVMLKAAAWVIEKIAGSLPLTITNAVAHAIQKLTRYGLCTQPSGTWNTAITQEGKCEQNGTPTPDAPVDIMTNNGAIKLRRPSGMPIAYQMVEWLKSAGAIPITDFKTKSTQEIETVFYRERSGASYLYSSDTATSGTTNTTAYLTSGAGNWRWDGKSYSIGVSTGIKFTSIQNKDGVWINGTKTGWYSDAGEFVSTNDLRLSSSENTTVRIYSMTIREGETVTLDLVPVQRLSDSAYGFYDKVSGNFYTNADATFEVGPVIDDPVEIYTDGTPEVLTIRGINLLDPSTSNITIGQQATVNGEITSAYPNNWRTDYIPVVGGKTYAFWGRAKADNTISAYNRINWYTATKTHIYPRPSYTVDTVTVGTAPSNAAYAMLSCSPYKSNAAITRADFDLYNWMFAEASAEIQYQPYVTPQTASVPMLLSVGDVKDEAELISGLLTHKVGIKVFDGTEDWTAFTSSTLVIQNATSDWGAVAGVGGYCTHLTVLKAGETTFAGSCRFATAFNLYEYKTAFGVADVAGFKAKLAEQYAAGTPVIVIYPRATETTEQGTAYPQLCNKLYDTADVAANVSDISVTFTTGEQTVPNPYSQLPIKCNNGELKWNGTEVVADGTPEVLTVSGINLYDPSTRVDGYRLRNTGPIADNSWCYSAPIPVKYGKTYTLSGVCSETGNKYLWFYSDSDEPSSANYVGQTYKNASTAGAYKISKTFNDANIKFIRIAISKSDEQVVFNEGNSAADYQPYVEPQTASVPMLLGVGSYKDEAELISGIKTGKVRAIVLDGTESGWTFDTTYDRAIIRPLPNFKSNTTRDIEMLCTHFVNKHNGEAIGNLTVGDFYNATQNGVVFHISQTNLDDWKVYLAAQYAAGTPVIVIYPRATETTEQITPQELTLTEGTNIIDSTSNVSPIDVEVEYAARKGA